MFNKKAQSILEYAMIICVIAAALLTMQMYMKRGLQGKFRQTADDLGEQYCPEKTKGVVTVTQDSDYEIETKSEDMDIDGIPDITTATTIINKDNTIKIGNEITEVPDAP